MKRSRMLLFFGTLAATVVGYTSWCSRRFYLQVAIPEIPQLPPEFRPISEQEIEGKGLRRPEEFTINRFWYLLGHPYDASPHPITVEQSISTMVFVGREGIQYPTVIFLESAGQWIVFDPSEACILPADEEPLKIDLR